MKYLEFEGRELEGDPYTGLLEAIGATSTLSALLDELVGKVCDENLRSIS